MGQHNLEQNNSCIVQNTFGITKNKTGNHSGDNQQTVLPLIHAINMRLIAGGPVGGLTTFQEPPGSNRCPPARLCLRARSENHRSRPTRLLDLVILTEVFTKQEAVFSLSVSH